MKRVLISLAALAISCAASATPGNNGGGNGGCGVGQQTNGCSTGGAGGNGGAGGQGGTGGNGGTGYGGTGIGLGGAGGSVVGSGNSSNHNTNLNLNSNQQWQAQGQIQGQGQTSHNSNANSATGGNATGGAASSTAGASASNGGNTTGNNSLNVEGDTTIIPRQAPAVSVGAPSQPITSCRLGISLGGSSSVGAGAGGIPIGNDATCLAGAQLAAMEKAGGFSSEDKQRAACGIEGMERMSVCKGLDKPKVAIVPVEVKTAKNEPTDPFVRARMNLPALK